MRKTLVASVLVAASVAMGGCSGAPSSTPSNSPSEQASAEASASKAGAAFDLQSHRGGRGETTEESLRAFEKSLDLGVTTLEFDIVLTKDGVPAVWHDPKVEAEKCADTAPASPNDPMFPYVGKLMHDLTWAQVQTLDCGKQLPKFPKAEVVKANKIIQLDDVFALTARRGADVYFNIETKLEAENREQSATPQEFVDAIFAVVDKHHMNARVLIQSFDWRSLPLVRARDPKVPLVLLWDETTWLAGSKWTEPVSYDSVGGDIIKAAQQLNVSVLSPGYSVPYGQTAADVSFKLVADAAFITKAHDAGMRVVPWTINDKATMAAQMDAGADGIITDYPTMLRELMAERALPLPTSYPAK